MKDFSWRNGLWALIVYTLVLSLLAIAQGTVHTPGFPQRVVLVALSGLLVGYFLSPLARSVPGSTWRRFWVLGLIIFTLTAVSNGVETALYLPAVALAAVFAGGIVQTAILAGVLTRVTRYAPEGGTTTDVRVPPGSAAVFIAVLAVLWLPVYFLFETLDTPVVHWLEHGTPGVFAHPALAPMLGLELVRGALHGAIMLGIARLAGARPRTVWLWGALSIAILNGWLPLLPDSSLPFGIRLANGCEITLSSVTFAGLAAYLFPLVQARHTAADQSAPV